MILPLEFYTRPAETVARDMLGKVLTLESGGLRRSGRIVETEAYLGPHDLAAHSSRGRTKRTRVLFGPPGRSYIYLIYGMYDLFNVVTGEPGDAVLVRAVEPLEGIQGKTDGPGKLTRAMGITREHNDLCLMVPPLFLQEGAAPAVITTSKRIGVDYAGEWKDAPLRFYDEASPYVSKR